jgi:octaheme c-type cytochrome (tetrathionate reductase family)
MRDFKYIWLVGLGVTLLIIGIPIYFLTLNTLVTVASDPWSHLPDRSSPDVDHTPLIQGEFTTGSDVTRVCLECHPDAGEQVTHTAHFTWLSDPVSVPGREEPVQTGKANLINNFCIGVQSNWTGCTRCHTGYGWTDANYDFTNVENVDCLACHDQSGTYVKAAAGQPAEGVDLLSVAQSVGTPSRDNCGACHFDGGGGNGVKHGDLDESLRFPAESVDVHMGRYDFLCVDCHQTENHKISGRAISVSLNDENGVACTDCHDTSLHTDIRVTEHLDTVACQTCHIPATALVDPTKVNWDWSQAGDPNREEDHLTYLRIKGAFIYTNNYVPQYAWFNGNVSRYFLGDTIDPNIITNINLPQGDLYDLTSLIYPFKVHTAMQPYDTVNNILLPPHTTGEDGYWTTFDWDSALRMGAEAAGLPYSGQYGFASTQMYWKQTHMVQPSENALTCTDCHGEGDRLDWQVLGYPGDPMIFGGRTS